MSINRICSFVLLSETNSFYNNVTQERKNYTSQGIADW